MTKNIKPALLTLGLAAFLTGAATAQTNVRGYSHVQQQRIHNAEHGVPNAYIYNRNAPAYRYNYNNNNGYYYNNNRPYAYPTNNSRYYNNNYNRNNGYNDGYYYNNNYYNNNRGVNVGPLRINY